MTLTQFAALWLLIIVVIAAITGCAVNPATGRNEIDYAATARILSAVSGALNPQPTPTQ